MGGKRWTSEEDLIIIQNYKSMRDNIQELLPDRAFSSIKSRACTLGVKIGKQTDWTSDEKNILINNYKRLNGDVEQLQKLLPKRTCNSIQNHIYLYGLAPSRPKKSIKDMKDYEAKKQHHKENWYRYIFHAAYPLVDELPEGLESNMEKCLEDMANRDSKRMVSIVYMYFKDYEPMEDIAKSFGITKERVKQILNKSMRMLRHPRSRRIIYGQQAIINQTENTDDEQLRTEYKNGFDDILKLSVRSYNCLRRAGIDTIDQLTTMSREDLQKVRNLSTKCIDEIECCLADIGLSLV